MKHAGKILAILMAVALLLGLAACGDKEPDILGEWYYYDENKHPDEYAPVLTFHEDGTYHFYVNLLEAMGSVTGTYEAGGGVIQCAVASKDFSGFSGDGIASFELSIGESTLTYNGGSFGDMDPGSIFVRKKTSEE
jgi:hypothetical protein